MNDRLLEQLVDTIVQKGQEFNVAIDQLRPYQLPFARRIVESVIINDGAEIIGEWCRQSGKSSTVATVVPPMVILLPLVANHPKFKGTPVERFRHGIAIGLFAPTTNQTVNLYTKIRRTCKSSKELKKFCRDIGVSLVASGDILTEFSNGGYIGVQSAAPTAKIESSTYDIIVLDECQDIETGIIRKSISPMLANNNGTTVKIGSPKEDISDCDFYESIQNHIDDPTSYFRVDSDVVEKTNPRYSKFLIGQRKRIGESSIHYQMSYKLVWPKERGMFITEDMWDGRNEYEGKGIAGSFDWVPEKRTGIQVAGIDWAKNLGDTIVTIGDIQLNTIVKLDDTNLFDLHIINLLVLHGDDYNKQYAKVIDFLSHYNIVTMNVDSTPGSVGDPLYDKISSDPELSNIDINGIPFSAKEKSRIYKQLQMEFQTGRLKIAGGYRTRKTQHYILARTEFTKLTKKTSDSNLLVVQKNKKYKDAKDDIPDSVCLCLDAAKSWVDLNIEEDENFIFNTRNIRSLGVNRSSRGYFGNIGMLRGR